MFLTNIVKFDIIDVKCFRRTFDKISKRRINWYDERNLAKKVQFLEISAINDKIFVKIKITK